MFTSAMMGLQFELTGGVRRVLLTLVVYGCIGLVWAVMVVGLSSTGVLPGLASGALTVLGIIQLGLISLGGCHSVHRAISRDYTTRMLESHRLSPMSAATIVSSYMFGANVQFIQVFLLNAILGVFVSLAAPSPVGHWLFGHLVVLASAVPLWAASVYFGLAPRKPLPLLPILIIAYAFGNVIILAVPAACVVLGNYGFMYGGSLVFAQGGQPDLAAIAFVIGLSGLVTACWMWVATAKYNRPDLPAFSGLRGLVLLAVWVTAGAIGEQVLAYQLRQSGARGAFGFLEDSEVGSTISWMVTLLGGFLLSAIIVNSSVILAGIGRNGIRLRGWGDRIRPVATALLAVGVIVLISFVGGWGCWQRLVGASCAQTALASGYEFVSWSACLGDWTAWRPWVLTILAFACSLVAFACFLFTKMMRRRRSVGAMIAFIINLWVIPLALQGLIVMLDEPRITDRLGGNALLGFSPFGVIFALWSRIDANLWYGIGFQAVVAAVMAAMPLR